MMFNSIDACRNVYIGCFCDTVQIAEALSFLHNTERVLHGNVSPQSILVTSRGL